MNDIKWVLLVEDDDQLADLTKEMLEYEGLVIKTARNGKEATDLMLSAQSLPALVITDFMMPVMNGGELIQKIKQDLELSNVPMILLSGSFLTEKQSMGVPIISKPLDIRVLRLKITELVPVLYEQSRAS